MKLIVADNDKPNPAERRQCAACLTTPLTLYRRSDGVSELCPACSCRIHGRIGPGDSVHPAKDILTVK
jgi:hypothetical protein